GLTSLILCQALLNVYAVLGLAPLTGVPLPFVSSGSTSLIVLLCSMGVLLNIASGGSAHLRAVPARSRRDDAQRRDAADDRDRRRGRAGRGTGWRRVCGRPGRPGVEPSADPARALGGRLAPGPDEPRAGAPRGAGVPGLPARGPRRPPLSGHGPPRAAHRHRS